MESECSGGGGRAAGGHGAGVTAACRRKEAAKPSQAKPSPAHTLPHQPTRCRSSSSSSSSSSSTENPPLPPQCTYNGQDFSEGEVYRTDPCWLCQCRGGVSYCSKAECAELDCDNFYVPEGECCPICIGAPRQPAASEDITAVARLAAGLAEHGGPLSDGALGRVAGAEVTGALGRQGGAAASRGRVALGQHGALGTGGSWQSGT
ncbi:hypothetical protein CRUP_012306, partial [Coryphaenoides rupestris]